MPHAPAHPFPWRREASRHRASSHTAMLRGSRIHYRTWSRQGRPPLLFVHGFGGHTHWWDWIAPAFCGDFDVAAMDLSGMGDSDWRTEYAPDTIPLDILELVDHLAGGPAHVVGHSFGGAMLLRACVIDSASGVAPRIRSAVVVDSFVRLAGHRVPAGSSRVGGQRPYADLATALGRFRLQPPQDVADPGMLDYLARHSLRYVEDGWRWKFDPGIPGPEPRDAAAWLRRITTPVDIVYGELSSVVDRALARACVDILPNGRGPVVIRGGAHHLMLDRPHELIAALRSALDVTG